MMPHLEAALSADSQQRGDLLDGLKLGCGCSGVPVQVTRDAHEDTGVDEAPNGASQLLSTFLEQKLDVAGAVCVLDIFELRETPLCF